MIHSRILIASRSADRRFLVLAAGAALAALAVGGYKVQAGAARDRPRTVTITVSGPDGELVSGAEIVVRSYAEGAAKPFPRIVRRTHANGQLVLDAPDGSIVYFICACKPGLAPEARREFLLPQQRGLNVGFHLARPEPFSGTLVDREGKPVMGAKLRIGSILIYESPDSDKLMRTENILREDLTTPDLEHAYTALTNREGRFVFADVAPTARLLLHAKAPGIGAMWLGKPGPPGGPPIERFFLVGRRDLSRPLIAVPAARIAVRVVTKLPGVSVEGIAIEYDSMKSPGADAMEVESTDASGRFHPMKFPSDGAMGVRNADASGRLFFDELSVPMVNVYVRHDPTRSPWTSRAAHRVRLRAGETTEVELELVRGVEVEGRVLVEKTGEPAVGAEIEAFAASRPEDCHYALKGHTDEKGRYHFRLPPGKATFVLKEPPQGFEQPPDQSAKWTIMVPEGTEHVDAPVLPVVAGPLIEGRFVDLQGRPLKGATVPGFFSGKEFQRLRGTDPRTDANGAFAFRLSPSSAGPYGKPTRLLVWYAGLALRPTLVPKRGETTTIRLAVGKPAGVRVPRDLAPGDFVGVVVDLDGRPIEGADVEAWNWDRTLHKKTRTDRRGWFRLKDFGKNQRLSAFISKPGHMTRFLQSRDARASAWVEVLDDTTYFEGTVTGLDGLPAAGALVRARFAPEFAARLRAPDFWVETRTGADGHYRLGVGEGQYEVRASLQGAGSALVPSILALQDEAVRLDVPLQEGDDFPRIEPPKPEEAPGN